MNSFYYLPTNSTYVRTIWKCLLGIKGAKTYETESELQLKLTWLISITFGIDTIHIQPVFSYDLLSLKSCYLEVFILNRKF